MGKTFIGKLHLSERIYNYEKTLYDMLLCSFIYMYLLCAVYLGLEEMDILIPGVLLCVAGLDL